MKRTSLDVLSTIERSSLDTFAQYSLDNEELANTNAGWCFLLFCTGFLATPGPIIIGKPGEPSGPIMA